MAVTWLGLIFGDDGTGWVKPPYEASRAAIAKYWTILRGYINLNTEPGSTFGQFVDALTQVLDLGLQADVEVVARTLFQSAQDVELDQLLQDVTVRVQASASRAQEYVWGAALSVVPLGAIVRSMPTGVGWAFENGVVIPAAPTRAYAVEVAPFAAGAYTGQFFTITVGGIDATIQAQPGNDGQAVRDALVVQIAAQVGITQTPYRAGLSPTNGRYALVVVDESGGGPFAVAVAAPAATLFPFVASSDVVVAQQTGPIAANGQVLRIGPAVAGVVGYANVNPAAPGRPRETDAQLRARHQVTQRGLGGGNPDAIRAIVQAPVDLGGGGALFCSVEYNPSDVTDDVGNKPHSIRVIVETTVDLPAVGLAVWKAKAAGDDMNGAVLIVIQDAGGANQNVLIDYLEEVWIEADIHYTIGEGWPNTGSPEDQMRQDVAAFIEALAANHDVRVNELPISLFPDGTPRGIGTFAVRLATGPAQGGPFGPFNLAWPTPTPDPNVASVALTGRQKARCVVGDVSAGP